MGDFEAAQKSQQKAMELISEDDPHYAGISKGMDYILAKKALKEAEEQKE